MAFAVSALAKILHAPVVRYPKLVRRIMRYLPAMRSLGIKFKKREQHLDLMAYLDFYWAECNSTRQATTAFVNTIKKSPIGFKIIQQTIVALSFAEAEYIALFTTAEEVT